MFKIRIYIFSILSFVLFYCGDDGPTEPGDAAWSPDGTQISFVTERDGNHEAYTMNADGTNPERLTTHPGDDEFPSWRP